MRAEFFHALYFTVRQIFINALKAAEQKNTSYYITAAIKPISPKTTAQTELE